MPVPTYYYAPGYPPTLASDGDREQTVEVLRGHWIDGRLTLEDLEDRSREALSARYVSDLWWAVRELPMAGAAAANSAVAADPQRGPAVLSVVLGSIGLTIFCISFGLLALLSLPLSGAGWIVGRNARRGTSLARTRTTALTGEVLGIVGTACALLAVSACAALLA